MATGKELKRLRGKITAGKLAGLLGVSVDRLRKWEERDSDPSDTGDIQKIERYFGVPIGDLINLKEFDFVENVPDSESYKDKYITSLERENKMLRKDLDLSLGELRHNILLARAVSETSQDLLIEYLAKQNKMKLEDFAVKVGIMNGEKYQKMKEEGSY